MTLTDEQIIQVALRHCQFRGEGEYTLNKYADSSAIVKVVRECMELAAEAGVGVAGTRHQTFSPSDADALPLPSEHGERAGTMRCICGATLQFNVQANGVSRGHCSAGCGVRWCH